MAPKREEDPFCAKRPGGDTCDRATRRSGIRRALHRYAETGNGRVKPLSGELEGLLRLRAGNHRVLFDETEDTVTVHRVSDRKQAYR